MTDLETQLAKIVEKSLQVAERTGEFVIEQAPELLQEFYMWHTTSLIMSTLIFLIIFVASCFGFRKFYTHDDPFDDIRMFIILVLSCFGVIFGGIFLIENIYNLLFITVAPKLYLIEYFLS